MAFEPATGAVVDCRCVRCPGAFEAYEEVTWGLTSPHANPSPLTLTLTNPYPNPNPNPSQVMWGLIGSYMQALDRRTGPG